MLVADIVVSGNFESRAGAVVTAVEEASRKKLQPFESHCPPGATKEGAGEGQLGRHHPNSPPSLRKSRR
ncbi:hypothetical protein LEMLEM_LOCUS6011 [Lemmus lemmus]